MLLKVWCTSVPGARFLPRRRGGAVAAAAVVRSRHLDECRNACHHGNAPEGCDDRWTNRSWRARCTANQRRAVAAGRQLGWLTARRTCRPRFRHVAIHYAHVAVGISMIDLRRRRRRRPSVAPSVLSRSLAVERPSSISSVQSPPGTFTTTSRLLVA